MSNKFYLLTGKNYVITWKTPSASDAIAECNGVRPVSSCALGSAPPSRSDLAASDRAKRAAKCNGVSPVQKSNYNTYLTYI